VIIAIGTDVIEVERIRRALENPSTGPRFQARVYTPAEIDYCRKRKRHAESFAARFAAKEAVMKALGRGFQGGVGWREIEVRRTTGRPTIVVHGRARELAGKLGITRWHLSLTHTAGQAMAYVIAEADGD
jgi:holo-[acyl-carrier protein] synthase